MMTRLMTVTVLAVLMITINACGIMNKPLAGAAKTSANKADGSQQAATPVQMIAEFNDISVPVELKRNDEQSSVYESPGFAVGVLVYEGYYKSASISQFFRNEMPKNEWQFINAFSEGTRHTLTFLKTNRSCSITIDEGTLSTKVTVRVGPTGN